MHAILLLCLPAAGLEDELKKLATTLSRPDSFKHEAARARDGLKAANAASSRLWAGLKGPEELSKPISGLKAAHAPFSLEVRKVPFSPKPRVRRVLKRDGHTISMLTFHSPSGAEVTANLYSPPKPGKSIPGLILVHSHHHPKSEGELQDMGVMWAKAGCHVLVMDQLGHGERRQHPFASAKDFPMPFRTTRQDYFFRHAVGLQLEVAGGSLPGWMAADISAGVSVLLEQRGTDKEKIAVLGSVAGGGDPAAVAAALDTRIKAAIVFNFGGPQPETRYPLPDDAEESFNYAGGGGWEPTRNLSFSARDGFLPWVIVGSLAPHRKLIHAHEFSWDEKRDPVWKRLQILWKKEPGNLKSARGFGTLTGKGADAGSHCNNIGAVHRKAIHAAFKEWWGIEAEEAKERKRLPAAELACLEAKEALVPARQLAAKDVLPVVGAAVRDVWKARLRADDRVNAPAMKWSAAGPAFRTPVPGGGQLTLILPAAKGKRPITVLFGQGGAKELLDKRAADIASLVAKGEAVAVVDLGGTADLPPGNRGRTSGSTSVASSFLMLGKPLLGERLRTLRMAIAVLRDRADIDASRIRLWGHSTQPANGPKETLVVPLEFAQPPHSEPVGPHLALVAALFEEGIVEVRARGGLASWLSLLDSPAVHFPYDNVVPGAARADWPGVAAALKIPVRMEGLVDGLNRRLPLAEARKLYAGAKNVSVGE